MESDLDGQVALVSGAAGGIGAAVARLLAERGAQVLATDLRAGPVTSPGSGRPQQLDVTDRDAVDTMIDSIVENNERLDILVNVAGVLRPATVTETTDEDWAHSFAVNTTGVFHLCRAAGRVMAAQRRGCIVTVGSNAAGVPRTGMAAYAASKAAAVHFTRCLGLELAASGVRCNVVSPGATDTAMQRQWLGPGGLGQAVQGDPAAYRVPVPLGRIAAAADIAEAVAFLASDRARHITLHDLYVDGGSSLRV
ncbi:2,3-dihydro-2,3-dihydroxybenzoate dehydrogenase [Streptomyces luteolus]|uniref:2,3-dihydro-2,3-dihydroxybenzoate dehydrogenase n=1 Tax=Streptomyces luteolus TaxID=3043615 RepID=A0ABT6SPS9_9ACTN|nr:2,3-dihydro-2,3-dihydroxybenzoate dehydrogenase [Streptomyces sp. B-S-A12]MDI3417619.1 2,3-dihydro-2,3-dihydroxybenzoate dehydrogenase [Streptomyces sp. B-S-A12]